jgi:hypothetical protein
MGSGGFRHGAWHLRPMPEDFMELAPTLHLSEALRHWSVGERALRRWYAEAGIVPAAYDHTHKRRRLGAPPPDDFRDVAPTLYIRELMHHYRRGEKVIIRWLKESGVRSRPVDRVAQARAARANKPSKPQTFERQQPPPRARRIVYTGPKPKPLPERDWSLHGQAADHLRRIAPVYRCWATGAFNLKGDHYRFGNVILTPDELLQRAKAKGWEAVF